MRLQIMQFKCAKCGDYFKAPDLSFESYGEFLLRTLEGEGEAYLNVFADKTYDEVSVILEKNDWMNEQTSIEVVDILKKYMDLLPATILNQASRLEWGYSLSALIATVATWQPGMKHAPRIL